MERIDLGISENYLKHWTVYDALRELYQNAFDREQVSERMRWFNSTSKQYKIVDKRIVGIDLIIGNYNTTISRETLLLGETSKTDNKDAIGKFGEGYKLAVLVLLRNKIDVSIHTGNELWTFHLRKNEQFNVNMLSVDIEVQDNSYADLSIMIQNLPLKLFNSYTQFNLKLQDELKVIKTDKCDVLLDSRNRSKIFVGGLYVCPYAGTSIYGYNFHPGVLPLGRDRNVVSGFDANWQAAKALTQASIDNVKVLNNVLDNIHSEDTAYLSNFVSSADKISEAMWHRFISEYPDSIPTTSTRLRTLKETYTGVRAVVVTAKEYEVLITSKGYKDAFDELELRKPVMSPEVYVKDFYDKYQDSLDEHFGELMLESMNWKVVD